MKNRLFAAFLLLLLLLSALPLSASALPGAALEIRLTAEPSETESAAAAVLQDYLEEITGKRPVLLENGASAAGRAIVLRLRKDGGAKPKGSYVLRAGFNKNHQPTSGKNRDLFIEAYDARGLWNGVYAFLRRLCSVEIFSADVKRVPKNETFELPVSYWYAYEPTLEYADTDWLSPHDLEFSLANGLNGAYSPLQSVHGGKVCYLWFCHSLTGGIVSEETFFETHPEYFALTERSGKREPRQLCLSNPDVVKQAIADVRAKVEADYDPDSALNIVSVTQADNQDYCVCENCTALAQQYGGQSGLMLWFVNQIAEAVEKDYPDVIVDTFAYQYTRHAPQNIRPRDNVCVRLCSIECCFSHTLEDPACERNAAFMKDLRDWSALSNRLYVWDYVTNFIQTIGVFPNFGVLRANIETFRQNHVVGIYEEGAYYADVCNAEFADLRAYLLACNMQDTLTAQEETEKRDAFLQTYYGEGAAEVAEFLAYITAHAGGTDGHLAIYQSMSSSLHDVSDADAERMDTLWNTAIQKAKDAGNTAAAQRLERSRLSWRYYEACAGIGEFRSALYGLPKLRAMKRLVSELKAFGVTRYNEGKMIEEMNFAPYFTPEQWEASHTWLYPLAMAFAALVLLAVVAAVAIAFRKKHPVCAVLMLLSGALALVTGPWASVLFVRWNRLFLYAVADTLMLLSVASFGLIAAWARNGFSHLRGKRLLIAVLAALGAAAVPYEFGVLLINTIILGSQDPTFAITLSSFIQMAIMGVNVALILVAFCKKKKKNSPPQA